MKIAINSRFGGFWLSSLAEEKIAERKGYTVRGFDNLFRGERTDPDLIAVIEELGEKASHRVANIRVIEIPDGIEYKIIEYDGWETVLEEGHYWE